MDFISLNFLNPAYPSGFFIPKIQGGPNDEPINEHYVKLCSTAEREAKTFATTVLTFFDDMDSLHHYLNSLFYNHSIMDNDQFAIYLGLMYEIVGCELPDDLDCYIVMDQQTNVFFNCYLATLLNAVITQMGGYQLCPAT